MFKKIEIADWESMVKGQLKTEDIYDFLKKDNLEGVEVKPYNNTVEHPLKNLPKVEASTHLVSKYHESLEEDVFAFLIEENVQGLEDKTFFVQDEKLFSILRIEEPNHYIALVDVFDEEKSTIKDELVQQLLPLNIKRSITIDITLHQNAGASIVQQLGVALAKAKELIEQYGAEIMPKMVFKIAIGANYFFEIAKLRAFKMLFNQLSKEYGYNEVPYLFVETSLRNKSIHDEENNLIRSTLELAAGMIGGADAVFSNNYKLTDQTPLSEEISFKQQIVLAYESIINVFEDATNGSYYVEDISRQFAEKGWRYFLEIEEKGGYLASLQSGDIQKEIYQQAITEHQAVKEGKIKLIGVNLYPELPIKKEISEMYNDKKITAVRWSEIYE